jgi:hypothetical protein
MAITPVPLAQHVMQNKLHIERDKPYDRDHRILAAALLEATKVREGSSNA